MIAEETTTAIQIAAQDIGQTCAEQLLGTGNALPSKPYVFELVGPRQYSSLDVQKAFEEVVGRKLELRLVEKEGLQEYYSSVLPPGLAQRYAEMTLSILPGGVLHENAKPTGEVREGKTEMVEVFRQLYGAA